MWTYYFSHDVSFSFDGDGQGHPISEKELRDTAVRLATALWKRGFDVGDVFGSSTDVWGFSVGKGHSEIFVGVHPPEATFHKRWEVGVMPSHPGWFKATRERRIAEMSPVEWAIHEALSHDLPARDVVWLLGEGRGGRQAEQPTPPPPAPNLPFESRTGPLPSIIETRAEWKVMMWRALFYLAVFAAIGLALNFFGFQKSHGGAAWVSGTVAAAEIGPVTLDLQ